MPLKEVFKRIYDKENGKPAINHKESQEKITAYFNEIVPEYDKERVYISDIRKIIQWYNLLVSRGILNFEQEQETEKPVEAQ